MTRFARAKGSKASNERKEEEPTPWNIMRQQFLEQLSNDNLQKKERPLNNFKSILNNKAHTDEEYWSEFGELKTNKNKTLPKDNKRKDKDNEIKILDIEKKQKSKKRTITESVNDKILSDTQTKTRETFIKKLSAQPIKNRIENKLKNKKKPIEIDNNTTNGELICTNLKIHGEKKIIHHGKKEGADNANISKIIGKKQNQVCKITHRNAETALLKKHKDETITEESDKDSETSNYHFDNFHSPIKKRKFEGNSINITTLKSKSTDNLKSKSTLNETDHQTKCKPKMEQPEKQSFNAPNYKSNLNLIKCTENNYNNFSNRDNYNAPFSIVANGREIKVINYEGFLIKKDDATMLKKLRKNLIRQNIPRDKIIDIMKLERRKAEKSLAREKNRVCFQCRQFGHNFSDCPDIKDTDLSKSGMCFKCGSMEHSHYQCKVIKRQDFRHAVCFICKEQGHIARQCSFNPQGQYPKGGSCHLCGEVTHLRKDCPKIANEKPSNLFTAERLSNYEIEEITEVNKNLNTDVLKSSKIVTF